VRWRHEGRYYVHGEFPLPPTRGDRGVRVADDGSEPAASGAECAYHLSYHAFQWKGIYHMVPESLSNRTVGLWRCAEFYRWEFDSFIMGESGRPINHPEA
jgi:hypothetical protein